MLRSVTTLSTLLSLLTLALAVPAGAQDATLTVDLLDFEEVECGQLTGVLATFESPDAPSVGPVTYELPYPPGVTPDFDPALTSSPLIINLATPIGGESPKTTLVEGLAPGDTRLLLEIDSLCFQDCAPIPFTNQVTMLFRIDTDFRGQLPFTATVTGPDFPTDRDSTTGTVNCDLFPQPRRVAATKTWELLLDADGDRLPDPGDRLRYTTRIVIEDGTAEGLTYQVPQQPHLELVAGSVATSGTVLRGNTSGDTTVEIDLGEVTSSTRFITYEVTISSVPAGVDEVSCQGTVSGENIPTVLTDDPTTQLVDDPTVTPLDFEPDLAVEKTSPVSQASPGEVVLFELSHLNHGRSVSGPAVLEETVPQHGRFLAQASSSGWSCTPDSGPGATCRLALGSLPPSSSPATATFAVEVASPLAADATLLTNTVRIFDDGSEGPDTNLANNLDSVTLRLLGASELTVTKTLDPSSNPAPGGLLVWSLVAANEGDREAADVFLTETVPQQTTFEPELSDPAWSCPNLAPGTQCNLTLGDLPGGASRTVRFAARLADPLPAGLETVENCVAIGETASPDPPTETCVGSPVPGGAPDLAVTKSDGGASVRPGESVLYILDVANLGSRGASGVLLEDTVPENTRFEPAASDPEWLCTGSATAGDLCRLDLGEIGGGGATRSAVFAVTVDPTLPQGVSAIENTVLVSDDGLSGPDADPSNNEDSEITPLTGVMPEVELAKTTLPASDPRPGGLLVWEIRATNTGNQDSKSFELIETVPPRTSFLPETSSPEWSCEAIDPGSVCRASIPALPAGGSVALTFAVRISETLPAGAERIENCAEAELPGTDSGMVESCARTPLEDAAPDLALTKTDDEATASPGGLLTYRFSVSNLGPQTATGVFVEDTLPPGTSPVGEDADPAWLCQSSPAAPTRCRLEIVSLAPGESLSADLTVRISPDLVEGVTALTNTATVSDDGANGADLDPTNNEATEETPVVFTEDPPDSPPRLEATLTDVLVKDLGTTGAGPGDALVYIAQVRNVGDVEAREVELAITPDPLTSLIAGSVQPDQGSVLTGNSAGDTEVLIALGTLAPGDFTELIYEVDIGELPDGVTHLSSQGEASATDAAPEPTDDPDTPEDDDPTLTPVVGAAPDPAEIPTVGEAGLAVLAVLLASMAAAHLRRRRIEELPR